MLFMSGEIEFQLRWTSQSISLSNHCPISAIAVAGIQSPTSLVQPRKGSPSLMLSSNTEDLSYPWPQWPPQGFLWTSFIVPAELESRHSKWYPWPWSVQACDPNASVIDLSDWAPGTAGEVWHSLLLLHNQLVTSCSMGGSIAKRTMFLPIL